MQFASRKDVNKNIVSAECVAEEYPIHDKDINAVVIEIKGRYPAQGGTINEVCKELAYIIEGSGLIEVEGKVQRLNEGDVVLIYPGERFYWQGMMRIFMPCTPAWYPEQHKEVD